ncbi:MAG: hypothetical protein H7144_08050 [Burkholderiales bacterium]|nr:hypothetical protein [Phycisphaerae bacterium]
MLARVGHKVREMTRTKMGTLELGKLQPGESRLVSPAEIAVLRKSILPKAEPKADSKTASGKPEKRPSPPSRKPARKPPSRQTPERARRAR